jgi:flagellar biogenesis protein FliO
MESVKHSETLSLSYAAVRTTNTEKLIELFINLLLIMSWIFLVVYFFPRFIASAGKTNSVQNIA